MNRLNLTLFLFLTLAITSCATDGAMSAGGEGANEAQDGALASISDVRAEIEGDVVNVVIEADSPISYTVFPLKDPQRLIIDMSQVDMSKFDSEIEVNGGPVSIIKPSYFADSNDSRLELALNSNVEDIDYSVNDSDKNKIEIRVARVGGFVAAKEKAAEEPAELTEVPVATDEKEVAYDAEFSMAEDDEDATGSMTIGDLIGDSAKVKNVSFRQVGKLSRIEVVMSENDPKYDLISRDRIKRLTIDLPNATISAKNERLINVNIEKSKIKNIAAFQFRGGDRPLAKVVVNLQDETLYNITSEDNRIILEVGDEAILAFATSAGEVESVEQIITAEEEYKGAPISLDFQKADIHNILRILADVSGYNVITSDSVKGRVTMKLTNVPWDQALDVILSNNGLDKIMAGNIIRVATVAEIQKENRAKKDKQDAEKILAPLHTSLFEVNYESAENMKTNLDSMKSERGKIEINERTNTLIIQDTKDKIGEMAALIKKLDKKEEQVLIEARIVEITHTKARELGIQWGGAYSGSTGASFPNTVGVTGATGVPSPNLPQQSGTVVNLPTISAPTGGIGLTLGHINGTALLDARLLAMESAGEGRVVSMPKITTMNNKEALIESGRQVPYQTTSSEGTKTEFKDATLSLKVTPHVTPDRNVRMEIEANKDEVDFANAGAAGPPIVTKNAKTEVLVANGETTVIGGLYKNVDQVSRKKVPGVSSIPIIGLLFKNKATSRESEELLIFITPKIVE